MAGGVSRLRRIAKRIGFSCASLYGDICIKDPFRTVSSPEDATVKDTNLVAQKCEEKDSNLSKQSRSICTICLEALDSSASGGADGQEAIFTAQCMHSFHFVCISSNVRHGSITCPICRAPWSQLPHDDLIPHHHLTPPRRIRRRRSRQYAVDPIVVTTTSSILEDPIPSSSHHPYGQWSNNSLHHVRYDDDEPVESVRRPLRPRLQLSLIPLLLPAGPEMILSGHQQYHCCNPPVSPHFAASSSYLSPPPPPPISGPCGLFLSIKLSHQQPTDIVLVASPSGPHTRLLRQSMALVVFSLRPADRLAIVICSSTAAAATRALPLRRMTSTGKQAALHAIDRVVFYLGLGLGLGDGDADPTEEEGLKSGIKILEDRVHRNPLCSLLHLSDSPTSRALVMSREFETPFPMHRFHVGFGFGASNGFVMHEFDEFLLRMLGGVIREAQLRIGKDGGVIGLGELRVGEERRIPLGFVGDSGCVHVGYSYIESGVEEFLRTGEVVVGVGGGDKGEVGQGQGQGRRDDVQRRSDMLVHGTSSTMQRLDCVDPFMARGWAKHLHGYRA